MNAQHNDGRRDGHSPDRPYDPFHPSHVTEEVSMNAQVLLTQPAAAPVVASSVLSHFAAAAAAATISTAGRPRLDQAVFAVGLGGAGGEAVTHFSALLRDDSGRLPANVALRAYDSADEQFAVLDPRFGRPVRLEPGVERRYIGRVPMDRIKRAGDRHAALLARLGPAGLKSIRRATIDGGAGQNRQEGLTTFYWSYSAIEADLQNTLRTLMRRDHDLQSGAAAGSGLVVLLFGSLPGGQGGGTAIDMAFNIREQVERAGLGNSCRILAIFFTPDAFPEARGPNMAANTWASLLEWDALMQGAGFEAEYPGGVPLRSSARPVDQVIVVGGIDENGHTLDGRDEAVALAAQAAAVMVSSAVGLREQFNVINETGVLDQVSPDGFLTCLATVGHAAIVFPARRLTEWCAVRQAAALAAHCLALTTDPAPLGLPAAAGLAERIARSEAGAPLFVEFPAPATLLGAPPEDAPALARTLASNGLKHRVFEAGYARMSENARLAAAELLGQIDAWSAAATSGARLGAAVRDLQRMADWLAAQVGAATGEAERLASLAQEAQDGLDAASAAMDSAADANFLVRKGQVRAALTAYLDQATILANARLSQRAAHGAATALGEGLARVRRHLAAAQEAASRLDVVRTTLEQRVADLAARPTSRSEIDLATPALRDQLYAAHVADLDSLAGIAADDIGPAQRWGDLAVDDLAARLVALSGRSFAPIARLTVEQVLQMSWDDRSAGHWIARLSELAAGAWNLDRALLPNGGDGLARYLTLGVPDAAQSIFAGAGQTLVSTHDPERIVALRTIYGASIETLQAAPQWRAAYEAHADRDRFHILPSMKQA
jgi:hypothetical protein